MKQRVVTVAAVLVAAACSGETPVRTEESARRPDAGAEARSSGSLADIVGVSPSQEEPSTTPQDARPLLVVGDRMIDYPSEVQMTMLVYRLRGAEPPFETWASQHQAVRSADEFSRPEVLRQHTEQLRSAFADTAGVGTIRFRANGGMSEYDSARQGFYITSFAPGTSYAFSAYEHVTLQFENALAAHLWPLTPDQASAVFARNQRERGVSVDMVLRIVGVEQRGNRTLIRTTIQNYTVHGIGRVGQLGAVELQ